MKTHEFLMMMFFLKVKYFIFQKTRNRIMLVSSKDALTSKDISSSYEVSSSERGFIARYCMKKMVHE